MLENFNSICEEKQKIIVSRDSGETRIHRAFNVNDNFVRHYRIDGVVIMDQNEKKCDFLLLNDTKKVAYIIEVKGTDLNTALKQLENTERLLAEDLVGFMKKIRIVYRANTHAIHSNEYKKFCLRHNGNVIAKTNVLEEKI